MQLVRGLHNLQPSVNGCVATIGNFDGVHQGHQAVLNRLRERARAMGLPSCVVIFEPQPREFFNPATAPARLTRLREKLELLAAQGIDQVLCLTFNRRLSALSAEDFVQQVLVKGLGVKHLEVGDDFRFGCDRAGDFAFLQQAAVRDGFSVEAANTIAQGDQRISSTRIRQALEQGDFVQAAELLGRPYSMEGRVLHGKKLGRQLGTPTANVQISRHRAPLCGVYLVSAEIEGRLCPGVANIGVRPSVDSDGKAHLEVHFLDFKGDLYGQRLKVTFHQKLRDEQKFSSLDALKAAIDADVQAARTYWQNLLSTTTLD